MYIKVKSKNRQAYSLKFALPLGSLTLGSSLAIFYHFSREDTWLNFLAEYSSFMSLSPLHKTTTHDLKRKMCKKGEQIKIVD